MNALDAIKTRRSTRQFLSKPVEPETLSEILECGRLAPSGVNVQLTRFLVIQDKKILKELAEIVQAEFAKQVVTAETSKVLAHSITMAQKGKYVFHYDAPVLIVTANKAKADNNIADCVCAIENMMIAANALDLGSCYINQLRRLNENPVVLAYMKKLGLADDERVYASVSIGYAASKDGLPQRQPLPRTGNQVTYI